MGRLASTATIAAVLLFSAPTDALAASDQLAFPQPDNRTAHTTPQTRCRRGSNYSTVATGAAGSAAGKAAERKWLDAGKKRAAKFAKILRPKPPTSAAAEILFNPLTAHAPAPGDPVTRRRPRGC